MGKLIKNHLARLIGLTAASYHAAASIQAFIWPKILWDFLTNSLDQAVKPVPILQVMNLFVALLLLALEWPLPGLPRWTLYHSFELRIVTFMTAAFLAFFLYQATNAAIYYLVGTALYIWAYSEGENICTQRWEV
ncbi:hypothetical protein F4824DRAFT_454426 [Ustulina deusta]|nr:hypothetical protein F4824DRAFT_454426 [Ustulina deusta]